MPDQSESLQPGLTSPGSDCVPVTPNDSTDLTLFARAILVGQAGTLRVTTLAGVVRNLPATCIPAGSILPVRVRRVHATGTTATDIFAIT
ncbi:MAG: hypothetical protein ACKVW3_12965 [Phycisphaerales bacterium]